MDLLWYGRQEMKNGKLIRTAFIALAMVLAAGFAGCKKRTECEICGETKSCHEQEYLGQKIMICDGCKASIDSLGEMFD